MIIERIKELKKQKGAVILAHYYTSKEVQEVADFLGDSLALSVKAKEIDAPIILFAGVNFMAETAKVLCPGKKVLLPVPEAGCTLAESCQADDFAAFKAKYPGYKVVSYVNTSVGVKALTDVCCTSTNALEVVKSIPADQPIIFGPDRNLGHYIKNFREHKVIPRPAKAYILTLLWASLLFCAYILHPLWLKALMIAIAIGVTCHILSYRSE